MNQEPINENNSKQTPAVKPRLNQPLKTTSQDDASSTLATGCGVPIKPDDNTKNETDEEFRSPRNQFFYSISLRQSHIYRRPGKSLSKILSKTMMIGFIM